ncbi:hypothetical protein P12x_003019 [Tundrisphaera lichenicola]|uniref:hypothetical protein n=1 Tax=Tundrisphaera lichenicola TaxID=2029860 RepID=UPI003EBAC6C1
MSTNRRTWQKSEGRAAAIFGALRQVLSGSSGRDDNTASDSTHTTLFIESKYRDKHAVRTLHDATRILARKEGKIPVVTLFDKGRSGFLVCIHSDDLAAVVAEYCGANASDELEGAIRRAYLRQRGMEIEEEAEVA